MTTIQKRISHSESEGPPPVADGHRRRLLEGLPVTERRMPLAGIATEGGEGPPVVLLHGPAEQPGEFLEALLAAIADS